MARSGPMAARLHAFPRERRLKRRRLIRPLFDRARPDVGRVRVGTVQILYRAVPREATGVETPLQVGLAPGRRPTAVERNRIRRAMRETFRQNQGPLLDALAGRPDCLTAFVLFRGRAATATADIQRDLPEALRRLAARPVPVAERPPGPTAGDAAGTVEDDTAGNPAGDAASNPAGDAASNPAAVAP